MPNYPVYAGNGLYLGEPRMLPNPGPKPYYPFRNMHVGQYITVPYAEQYKLMRYIRNVRRHGIKMQMLQAPNGDWNVIWVA